MLEIRPNCEFCDKDLPPESLEARICTYECTFCAGCVDGILKNVCPNCGGGFTHRPIRPKTARRPMVSREHQAAGTKRRSLNYSLEDIKKFVAAIKDIPPDER